MIKFFDEFVLTIRTVDKCIDANDEQKYVFKYNLSTNSYHN